MCKKLIVTVGLPRSGKSTWARQSGFVVVDRDEVGRALIKYDERTNPFCLSKWEKLFDFMLIMIDALFAAGHNTIVLDYSNIIKQYRDAWKSDEWETEYRVFTASKEECLRRTDRESTIERINADYEICDVQEIKGEQWNL